MGVEIFFVLSGFVIPYAMHRSGYTFPGDVGRFLARRLVRLDPPYLVSSTIAGILSYVAWKTPGFRGGAPQLSWAASLAHLGYLNGILHQPWYNDVCWTLGIEFQFYVAAAILFPLLLSPWKRFPAFAFWILAMSLVAVRCGFLKGAFAYSPWLLSWAPLFMLGVCAFRYYAGICGKSEGLCISTAATLVAIMVGRWEGALAGASATLFLALGKVVLPRWVSGYAGITYSLYLVHMPIGCRVVRVVKRLGNTLAIDCLALTLGVAASLLVAVIFWRLIEVPAQNLAAKIKLRRPC